MHITVFHKSRTGVRQFHFSRLQATCLALLVLLGLPLGAGSMAWHFARHEARSESEREAAQAWNSELEAQRRALAEAKQNAQHQLDTLTAKLGVIQAQAVRLDALGERLTQVAGIDPAEFNFSEEPGYGGPSPELSRKLEVYDFIEELDRLSGDLGQRDEQLSALETVLLSRNFDEEQTISGRPVKQGWISSYYGTRTDPFEGSSAWHEGMDFSGLRGSDVSATAAGIVTFAGKMNGYGNLVEISHGDGMSTR